MLLHGAPQPAPGSDFAGAAVVGIIFIVGGALNLLAAFIGMRREGELRSTMGRQLQAVLGKRGTIALWLVLGVGCIAGGAWFLVGAS